MSHHLVTVCMFCLLCATHSTCGAHINTFSEENDPSYTIVQFQENTERPLPFHLKEDFREFDHSEPLNPYREDGPKEHGIRKKNLSEEKKMRYLQKLSKIRTHRANNLEEFGRLLELTHVKDNSESDDAKSIVASDLKDIVAIESDLKDTVSHASDLKDILRNASGLKDSVRADASDLKHIVLDASDSKDIQASDLKHVVLDASDSKDIQASDLKHVVLDASDLKDIKASDLKDSAPDAGDLKDSVRIDTKQLKYVPKAVTENAISDIDKSDDLRKSDSFSVNKRSIRDVKDKDVFRDFNSGTYVKRLINMYGDPSSMTMNVSGLNAMLRELDLMKMVEGGHVEMRIPEYVYTNGHEEETNHTCVSSAELITTVNMRLNQSHHHDGPHRDHKEPLLNEASLQAICPIILYQKLANTSHERQGCIVDKLSAYKMTAHSHPEEAYTTRRFEVWLYSSLSIFAISACGLLGVAVVPIMHKDYYNHIMQFLIALAIGTLGGDAFLHLIPHALSAGHSHGEGAESSHNDGMWKGLAAMMGVVFFYFTEKGLTVIAELRKRRQKLDKENKLPSRVRVMRDEGTSGCAKPLSTSSTNSFLKIFNSKCKKQEDPDTKMCKHKYSEYPYCYDEITTDTHDHHHHRDGQIPPPSPKSEKILNNSVSVVSSNNLVEKESEPTAKDWLLNYMDDGDKGQKLGDSAQKDGVEMNNIKHKDGEVSKDPKDEESYTVILREHSRAHHGHSHSHGHVHAPPSSLSSVVWMVIMGDGLHNFTDGMAIGAAFASNIAVGFSTAIAVLCHELPHELGDFAVLLKAGMSVRRAIFYNVLSSVLCVAGMVCGVLVGHAPAATSWVFAVAAGLFIYIALADLVPELSSSHSKEGTLCQCMLQFLGLCTGIGIMLLIALYEHDLERLFG